MKLLIFLCFYEKLEHYDASYGRLMRLYYAMVSMAIVSNCNMSQVSLNGPQSLSKNIKNKLPINKPLYDLSSLASSFLLGTLHTKKSLEIVISLDFFPKTFQIETLVFAMHRILIIDFSLRFRFEAVLFFATTFQNF